MSPIGGPDDIHLPRERTPQPIRIGRARLSNALRSLKDVELDIGRGVNWPADWLATSVTIGDAADHVEKAITLLEDAWRSVVTKSAGGSDEPGGER